MEALKVTGDVPQARFGHTITLVSKTKAVLFGGATGDTGKYSITGDTFIFDCITRKWKKLDPSGSSPTARAAHSSTTVETNQLVIYGGATGGGQLAPDDLYLLDLRSGEDHSQWIVVPVVGTTPGRRYGHTIAFSKPYLIVYGGNTGNEAVNDVWILNVEKAPLFWTKLECDGDAPPVRVYHAASLCSTGTANGMMVVFGGRTGDQQALNDTWGLRRHRDGRWDWVKAPYKANTEAPIGRYQHSTLFMGSYMFVIGGRTNNVGETVPMEIYDCESSEWMKFTSVQRFRHACWLLENSLYIHGGFEQDSPNIPTDAIAKLDVTKFLQTMQGNSEKNANSTTTTTTSSPSIIPIQNPLIQKQQTLGGPSVNTSLGSGKSLTSNTGMIIEKDSTMKDFNQISKTKKTMNQTPNQNIRISDKVVVATAGMADFEDKEKFIKHVSIDKLQEESKKIKFGGVNFKDPNAFNNNHSLYYESIYNPFISGLLTTSKEWVPPGDKFPFKKEQIIKLIDETIKLFASQPGLLHLRVPAKIYGNIHGQYGDLLRLFENWGTPTERGDIDSFDYLFLGNYVDRGRYSLEVMCLLLSLKLKYPEQFHLLRGSHEDVKVNKAFGFAEECQTRLGEDINDYKSIFQRFNELFKFLPIAAVVEGKILCVHAGIGRTLRTLEDIESLQRPIDISLEPTTVEQNFLMDLLWSDPESEYGTTPQKYNVPQAATKYDADRLKSFLGDNNLIMMIRSHEVVNDGFEKSANGMVMTVFSATDYCGKYQNAAGVVVIKKNFELVPKVIYPIMNSSGNFGMDEEKGFKSKLGFGGNSSNSLVSPWLDTEETFKKRPPTPPRSNTKSLKK